MFTTINNNKYDETCTLDMIHVKKRHNTERIQLQHIIEILSVVINDLLLHKWPLLSRIAWNQSLR